MITVPDAGDVRRMKRAVQIMREECGVIVYEQKGCYESGGTYPVVPVGSLDHHDAASVKAGEWGAHAYCLDRRICTVYIPRCWDGVQKISIIAAGVTPHAGVGSMSDVPGNRGNDYLYGCEKANSGSEAYTNAAYLTQVKWNYASHKAASEQQARDKWRWARAHKEYGNNPPGWAGRKTDVSNPPNGYDMNRMRNDVVAFTPAGPVVVAPGLMNPNGAIFGAWKAKGGSPGVATTAEIANGDGGVRQGFANGEIAWWHPTKTGDVVFWTHGGIGGKHIARNLAADLSWAPIDGYPTSNMKPTHDAIGIWQQFENSLAVFFKGYLGDQAQFVVGDMCDAYLAADGTRGRLAYPAGEEYEFEGGLRQDFQGGAIFEADDDDIGAHVMVGDNLRLWVPERGFPVGNEENAIVQMFEHQSTIWTPDDGLMVVNNL